MKLGQKKDMEPSKVYNFCEELKVLITFLIDSGVNFAYIVSDGENTIPENPGFLEELWGTKTLGKDDSTTMFINALCGLTFRSSDRTGYKPLIRVCLDAFGSGYKDYHIYITKYGTKENFLSVLKRATKRFCKRDKVKQKLKSSEFYNIYKDNKIYTKSGFHTSIDLSKMVDDRFIKHMMNLNIILV